MALPITVYGSHTCEDTALVRDRLLEFNIPFTEYDKEEISRVAKLLTSYGHGSPRTPTIVFGDRQVLIEPKVRELDNAIRAAGYVFTPPTASQFDKTLAGRPAPDFKLSTTRGGKFELGRLRGSRWSVLFFAHNHTCRACQGFARQFAAMQTQLDARLLIILQDKIEQASKWAREFAPTVETLADSDSGLKLRYASHFGVRPEGVLVLLLDLLAAPRAGSVAPDAGGLIAPQVVGEWAQLMR